MRDAGTPGPRRTPGNDDWGDDRVPAELREALRARVELGAGARTRLASALAGAPSPHPAPRLARVGRWLVRPLRLPLPPLAMGAAAAALVIAGVMAGDRLARTRAPARAEQSVAAGSAGAASPRMPDSVRVVRFVLVAPGARRVALVGDFNAWDAARTPMRAGGAAGVWTVELPVTAGRHLYAFVVDGTRWVVDPAAPLAPEDDFGTRNSVLVVGAET